MTEIQESYGTAARATYAGGGASGGVDLIPQCPHCGCWAGFSAHVQGRASFRVQCRNRRCGRSFTVRRDSGGGC